VTVDLASEPNGQELARTALWNVRQRNSVCVIWISGKNKYEAVSFTRRIRFDASRGGRYHRVSMEHGKFHPDGRSTHDSNNK
jgi:hypothetical protein